MANERPIIKPCKLTDELYWIGAHSMAPAHLILTSDGIVLIDTGSIETRAEIMANIESLGFDVRDVKHIIHSHGHYDHVGATNDIVKLSGAKTYIGLGDEDAVRGANDLLWATKIPPENENDFYFEPDVIIKDGDVFKFGDTEIRFVATPGHTAGVISMFFKVHHGGREYLAGMFGGAGYGSMDIEYLDSRGLPRSLREDYVRSINRIIDEPVEVHIGNHPKNNNHVSKAERKTDEYNPFVEEKTWVSFLTAMRDEFVEKNNIKI